MSDTAVFQARLQGRDATHRTRNLDTHLTHGCIQLFRHFSRVRQGCAGSADCRTLAIQPFSEGAPRTLAETAR